MDGQAPAFYDIDNLRKMSVSRSVEMSPIRYAILRSRAPRFQDSSNEVPFGAYNTDTAQKKSMESQCRDNRRFYASSFQSTVPRFNRSWSTQAIDVFYDPERTKNSKPNSVDKAVATTSIHYAIHRSKYKRFTDHNRTEGPDVVYDTDSGTKQSLYSSMINSPMLYKNVGSATDIQFRAKQSEDFHALLSPGMYDSKLATDICVSPALEDRPLSSLISRTPRFGRDKFTGYGLGSTYRPEVDQRKWLAKDCTISKAEYLRPQYLPKAYAGKPGERGGPKAEKRGAEK